MPGEQWNRGGDEWQELVIRILKHKYPNGGFIEIPDRVEGDGGLEGFSRDGDAYQCYASEELLDLHALTTNQKRKIRDDLRKLRKNAALLEKILGTTKIKKWILVVPYWDDKDLLIHANKKAAEIASAGLPFIAPDFQVAICTLEDYEEQVTALGRGRRPLIEIEPGDLPPAAVEDWIKSTDGGRVDNLSRKCRALRPDPASAMQARSAFIRQMLQGQNALDKLRARSPDLYGDAVRLKRKAEAFLETESLIGDMQPPGRLRATQEGFYQELQEKLPGVEKSALKHISYEAVVDWLARCPLNFAT